MRLQITIIIIFLLSVLKCFGQEYGVRFANTEVAPEMRTSIDLNPAKEFYLKENFEVSYFVKCNEDIGRNYGYISRIILNDEVNIDFVLKKLSNDTFDFFVIVGSQTMHTFRVSTHELYEKWVRTTFKINKKVGIIEFSFDNQKTQFPFEYPEKNAKVNINFGNTFNPKFISTSVPNISIRDIHVLSNNRREYHWPLNEVQGEVAYDEIQNSEIHLNNPTWIKSLHVNWKKEFTSRVPGKMYVTYDPTAEDFFLITSDKVQRFSPQTQEQKTFEFMEPIDFPEFTKYYGIFDTLLNAMYCYNATTKELAYIDYEKGIWEKEFYEVIDENDWYNQHSRFIYPGDSSLYIFGGYGQYFYQNEVQRYNYQHKTWDILEPKGDPFYPRCLSALGTSTQGDTAYILGGIGSLTGDQAENSHYYSDLMMFTVKDTTFHHLFDLSSGFSNECFASSMVIDGSNYYALSYPVDVFNNEYQLRKGSLKSPSFEKVGAPILFNYYQAQTYVDLFYASKQNKIYAAIVFDYPEEKESEINIFSLEFPPDQFMEQEIKPDSAGLKLKTFLILGSIFIFLIGVSLFFIVKKTKRKQTISDTTKNDKPAVSITLFGSFQVISANGENITKKFSPQLKELFLLILLSSIKHNKGISKITLSEVLWNDSDVRKTKNKRAVSISLLRNLLQEIGNITLNSKTGNWMIEFDSSIIYCDYWHFERLLNQPITNDSISQILDIVQEGKLLTDMEQLWLDEYKSDVSNSIVYTFITRLEQMNVNQHSDLIVKMAGIIFKFDSVNEEAMHYKCKALKYQGKHSMAKECYNSFCKEYKTLYNENYSIEFSQIFV